MCHVGGFETPTSTKICFDLNVKTPYLKGAVPTKK